MTALLAVLACAPSAAVKLGDDRPADGDTGDDSGGGADSVGDDTEETAQDTGEPADTESDSDDTGEPVPIDIAVDLILPATGTTEGGDTVTLYGGPFAADAVVTFAEAAAQVVSWTSTTLDVETPPGPEGVVDVHVETSEGSGVGVSMFAYEAPCLGMAVDPANLHMDMQTVNDASVALTGCATGIHVSAEITNLLEVVSVPESIDGSGTAVLRYYGNSSSGGYGDWTVTLGSDQGEVDIAVHVD